MSDIELLRGAVTALHNAIHPLIREQLRWQNKPLLGDSLYQRMTDAKTAATASSGAPMQASKAPARMDVLAWFVDVDGTVAQWPGPAVGTTEKLAHYYDHTWNPTQLRFIKMVTRHCERWAEQAKNLLGDTPPAVPLRQPCPLCGQLWAYSDDTRQYALKAVATMDSWHALCAACKTVWRSDAEQAVLRRLLDGA